MSDALITRIIGIDPGSRKLGWGVIDVRQKGRELVHIAHGVMRLDVEQELPTRMRELVLRMRALLDLHAPQQAVLEDIFVSESARSALILGQARGAVLACLGLHDIGVSGLSPTRVKLAVAGSGRASKTQVGEMVRALLKLDAKPPEDAGDALALAICHAQMIHSPLAAAVLTTPKRASKKQKQQGLYDLAKAQGKL